MEKHRKLLRHCHYCEASTRVTVCVCVRKRAKCEGAFVLLRVLWRAGRCERWGARKRLA